MQKLLTWLVALQLAISTSVAAQSVPTPPPNWVDIPIEDTASSRRHIIKLDLKARRIYLFGAFGIVASYPVAIGKKGWETPIGTWQIREKLINPAWTNFKNGRVVPAGTNNPLGSRWLSFWTDGKDEIGFHGTRDLGSIGRAASHGCVRMRDADVRDLFDRVAVGTKVLVY